MLASAPNLTLLDQPCTGNASEICGGPDRLSFFWNGKMPPPPPVTLPNFGLWESLGCYKYVLINMALPWCVDPQILATRLQVVRWEYLWESKAACLYNLAAVLASMPDTIWLAWNLLMNAVSCLRIFPMGASSNPATDCDAQFENFGAPVTDGGCTMPCAGNSSEFCGGPNRLNVYNFTGIITTPLPPPGGGGGGSGGTPHVTVTGGLPPHWNYSGCYV